MTRPTTRPGLHPTVYRMASTHFIADIYSNVYAPLLPALIPKLGLSLTGAGTLAMLYQMAASVSQLGFGRIADRWRPRLLLVAGPLLSVSVLSLIGIAPTVPLLALCLVVGGLGGAAFHPSSAALVNRLGGRSRGLAMAIHITGGSIGYALSGAIFAPFAQRFGLEWTPVLAIPGLLLLGLVLRGMPQVEPLGRGEGGRWRALRPYARPLTLLYLVVVVRTVTSLGFATFMPVLLTSRGWSVGAAGAAVSAYQLAGGVGGFMGGPLADRFGPRRIIALSLVLAVPFLASATLLSGWPFVFMMAVGGFCLQSTLPVNVTFAHQIAPVSAATVSSLMLGFAWGTGGLAVPLVGAVADRVGIDHALLAIAILPLAGAACALPLPRSSPSGRGSTPAPPEAMIEA
jgi:MFS transporter, FSR family, fosmidomycin resistance protein